MRDVLTPARGALLASLLVGAGMTAQAQLRPALDVGEQATRRAEQVQTQINQLDDERSDLIGEFRTLVQRKDSAELNARQLAQAVESQAREIESLTEQLSRIDEITAVMVPMMLDLIDDLELFIEADLPFQIDERRARIARLRNIMNQPNVVPAEQYRLIMEEYKAELAVGNTIDTWTDEVVINDRPTDVDMFRYGRVSLVYLTKDGRRAARWSRELDQWEPLDREYNAGIEEAIRIAKELVQPNVIFGPFERLTVTAGAAQERQLLPEEAEEFRRVLLQTQNETIFTEQQELTIAVQEDRIASLQAQIEEAPARSLDMLPVLETMVDDLEDFILADLPFRRQERLERVETLRAALARGDELALSERYRLIIQTYQDELASGTVQETWKDEIDLDGSLTEVILYRYGRTSLVYLTADRRNAGRWDRGDPDAQPAVPPGWVSLGGGARNDIAKAIRIAEGREQQSVLLAPVEIYSVQ
ncbi:MAG: DUF3450 domain-containing protein [Pseudomonadota bacterium]